MIKNNLFMARNTIVVTWILIIVSFLYFSFKIFHLNMIEVDNFGSRIYSIDIQFTKNINLIIYLILLSLTIITITLFILWFNRAYKNMHQRIKMLTYNKSASIYGWFIPFINLYLPYKIMAEMNNKANLIFVSNNYNLKPHDGEKIIKLWWITGIYNIFFILIYFLIHTYDIIDLSSIAEIIINILIFLILNLYFIMMIRIIRMYEYKERVLRDIYPNGFPY